MKLEGKVAIVTGAARGIGQAIAERFVAEGAKVVCADLREEVHELSGRFRHQVKSVTADVSSTSDIKAMVQVAVANWGQIDVLCNNAGIVGTPGMLTSIEDDEFDQIIAVNLKSVFLTMKYAIPVIASGGGGSIINIASAAGLVGVPEIAIYCGSKAGVIGLTRAAALENGPNKIRVNAICPGNVLTPLNREHVTQENYDQWMAKQAIKRMGEAGEIAGLATYLASDDAAFVTGTAIPIDGGMTAA